MHQMADKLDMVSEALYYSDEFLPKTSVEGITPGVSCMSITLLYPDVSDVL